jgi:hypothetical protein
VKTVPSPGFSNGPLLFPMPQSRGSNVPGSGTRPESPSSTKIPTTASRTPLCVPNVPRLMSHHRTNRQVDGRRLLGPGISCHRAPGIEGTGTDRLVAPDDHSERGASTLILTVIVLWWPLAIACPPCGATDSWIGLSGVQPHLRVYREC